MAQWTDSIVLLTMTAAFSIPYGESVLYNYVKITFVGGGWMVAFLLIVRGPVARLGVRSAVVFFSRATLLN